jgi:hypothetical protein
MVDYNDLQSDLSTEMRRIADFLAISVAPDLWPRVTAAASFGAMRRDGDALMSSTAAIFRNGSRSFFFKGANGRWRGVANKEDLALYEAKAEAMLPPACARWAATGRAQAGDPGRRSLRTCPTAWRSATKQPTPRSRSHAKAGIPRLDPNAGLDR